MKISLVLFSQLFYSCVSSGTRGSGGSQNNIIDTVDTATLVDAETLPPVTRKLVGSNCVLIETGIVPRYYKCIGCDITLAVGCVTDMRTNASYNVAPSCQIASAANKYDRADCCPRFGPDFKGVTDLYYVGSAYPMALRCISDVGCASSSIYTQLLEECYAVCPPTVNLDQKGGPACLANFNGGQRNIPMMIMIWITTSVAVIMTWWISV